MSSLIYKNIFMYASLQFCGNIEDYFSKHTDKLLVYIVMPRLNNKFNLLRLYKGGKLIEEKKVWSSDNLFLYYFSWLFHHNYFLLKFFKKNERPFVIAGHPVCFFGMSIQRFLKNAQFVYWVGDYFPGNSFVIRLYEVVKKHYQSKTENACYLSDGINKVMNGKVLNTKNKKTIMWGVKPKDIKRSKQKENFSILFVGLVKESQGLERVFRFLNENKDYDIKIIGICDKKLYKKYKGIISRYKISSRVFFPNKFFSDEKLNKISERCRVGVALYDISEGNPTFYTDPGKVKAYTEMMLPVIMSDTSGIAPFIKKFKCGIVIDNKKRSLEDAFIDIKKNYNKYASGIKEFNRHFYYEDYYRNAFSFLEK